MVSTLWAYRGFVLGSVGREFQSKYRNSLLGAAWTILNPLAMVTVYTVIFSRLFNNEILSFPITIAVTIAILGSVMASMPDKIKLGELKPKKEILWPFIAAVCIGLSDTISKGYINRSNDFSFLFSLGFVQIPVAIAYLKIEKQSLMKSLNGLINKFKNYQFALLGGLFNIIGTGFLFRSGIHCFANYRK